MKFVAIAVFLLLASDISAQTLNINGAAFYLGESEAKARADIAAADMTITTDPGSLPGTYWLRVKRGSLYELLGGISFADGKVNWIDRDWYLNQTSNDKNVLAQVFYSAVTSLLEGNDSGLCSINVKSEDRSPNSGASKTTTIVCHKGNHKHSLILIGVDCSGGCSIGTVVGSLSESIRAEKAQ